MPVRRTPQIPRLMHYSRHMLTRIDWLTGIPAAVDLRLDARHVGAKLRLVIEYGHHHVPPLPPLRVKAVMADDETPYVVVIGVNSRHSLRVTPSFGVIICTAQPRPGTPGGDRSQLLGCVAHQARPIRRTSK